MTMNDDGYIDGYYFGDVEEMEARMGETESAYDQYVETTWELNSQLRSMGVDEVPVKTLHQWLRSRE